MIHTDRLVLRSWHPDDLEPFAHMNADPHVMKYFPSCLTQEESNGLAQRIKDHFSQYGWGLWAASLLATEEFIGFIGLQHVPFQAHFTPAVEIGWRLSFSHWGKGYATEGAKAVLKYGFQQLNLKEIVAFTTVANQRSRRVMEKIGMHHDPQDDFDHPNLPSNHPLKKHVLYRL